MKKYKNLTKPVRDINQPVEIKSDTLRFFFPIIFLIWCSVIIGTYASRSGLSSWIQNSLSVIRMDKSDATLSEMYETDVVVKPPADKIKQISSSFVKTWKEYFISFFLLSVILAVSFSLGWKLLEFFKLSFSDFLEVIVFSVSLGLGILAYMVFLLGALSLLYQKVIYGLIIVSGLYSVIYLGTKYKYLRQTSLSISLPHKSVFDKFLIAAIIFYLLINLIGTLAPETWYDTLLYHFTVPQYYLIHHGIRSMHHNIYSNLTGTLHMLYLLGLTLAQNEALPKLINFSMSILVCLSLYSFCRRYFSNRMGILSVAIFYTIPLVAMGIWRSQVEIGLSLFIFLSIYAFVNWNKEKNERTNWLVISAIFVGLATATKYIGFVAFLSTLILLTLCIKNSKKTGEIRKKQKLSIVIYFILICFIIESPWLIKNYIIKSNPVYPYFTNIFTASRCQGDKIDSLKQEIIKSKIKSIKDWLSLPWNMTMKSRTESPLNGPIFLTFLPLVLFFLFLKDSDNIFKNLLLFFIIYYLLWSFLSYQARFLIPALSAMSIVIACIFTRSPVNIRKFLPLLFVLITLLNVSNTLVRLITLNGWRVVFGLISYEDYLSSKNMTHNAPSYRAISFINNALPENSKILFWGETRAFPCRKDFIAHSVHNMCPFDEWARESENGKELYEKLKEQKITHILWNVQETQRLGVPEVFFSQESDEELKSKLADFSTKHLKEIFSTRWTRLFEIN